MGKPTFEDGTEIDLTIPDEHKEDGLNHVSKSRIKIFLNCPRKFYNKYWAGNRPPGSYHTEKGSEIHRAYEDFHLNLIEYVDENDKRPEFYMDVMGDWHDYSQWIDPHIENFWQFEDDRWYAACEVANERVGTEDHEMPEGCHTTAQYAHHLWLPVGVEIEGRLENPPVGDLPWMGYADAVLHAASVPQIEEDEGVVIVDYKTGKTEDPKYRDKGIYLEGEFYGWLFEEDDDFEHEIVAVAGYYPQNDDFVVSPYPNYERRGVIMDAVEGMQQPPEIENYPIDEQPLCHYGHGRCAFYNVCESSWGLSGGAGYHNKAEDDHTVSKSQKERYGAA